MKLIRTKAEDVMDVFLNRQNQIILRVKTSAIVHTLGATSWDIPLTKKEAQRLREVLKSQIVRKTGQPG